MLSFTATVDAAALNTAFASFTVKATFPGAVTTKTQAGGAVLVTLTGMSPSPLDGIVDWGESTSGDSKHFTGLKRGETTSVTLKAPSAASEEGAPATVRVRVGDQSIISSTFPVSGEFAAVAGSAPVSCKDPKMLSASPTDPQRAHGYEGGVQCGKDFVQQDVWSQKGSQWMKVCSVSDWEVIAQQDGKPESGVKTYPDSELRFTDYSKCSSQPTLASFKSLSSSYGHVAPNSSSWDFAYDIFIGGGACKTPITEVMIWTQWHDVSPPVAQMLTTIDGVSYDVYHHNSTGGGSYIQMRMKNQNTSGKVDILKVFEYLGTQGLLALATDTLQFVQYGVEVLTTCAAPYTVGCKGINATFSVNAFDVSYANE